MEQYKDLTLEGITEALRGLTQKPIFSTEFKENSIEDLGNGLFTIRTKNHLVTTNEAGMDMFNKAVEEEMKKRLNGK